MSCLTISFLYKNVRTEFNPLFCFHVKQCSLTRLVCIAACVVVVTTLAGRVSAQGTNVPTLAWDYLIAAIEGKVEVRRSGAQAWEPAHTNKALYAGDQFRVPEGGKIVLLLSDKSVARFGELSEVTVAPQALASKQTGFSLTRGLLYFFHRGKPADFDIKTKTSGAAVRGTEFNLEVEETDRAVLTMLDGVVELSNDQGRINLQSGEQGIAAPGKPPTKTAVLNPINVIQWALYYPAVLDLDELNLGQDERLS